MEEEAVVKKMSIRELLFVFIVVPLKVLFFPDI